MKTNANMYHPPKGSKLKPLPLELQNSSKTVIQYVTSMMRMFGISKIAVKPRQVGIRTVSAVSFKAFPAEVPPAFKAAQGFMVRNLAEVMHLFGVLDVAMQATAEDVDKLAESWKQLQAEPAQAKPSSDESIELNIDEDPTGEPVIDGKQEEKPDSQD
jgi:hypothetical protein